MNEVRPSLLKPKEMFKALQTLFSAMVIGFFIFIVVSVFVVQVKALSQSALAGYQKVIVWIMAAISLICLIVARMAFNKGITEAKNSLNPLPDKLSGFRNSLIRYLAICEAPALANIIAFMLTGNFVFLVFASVLLGFMLSAAPIRRRVVAMLELDWEQQKELD
jgi:FtsH-binding integral membrane protein